MIQQCASSVILIRPTGFGFDPETAASNAFQQHVEEADVTVQAALEFDGLLGALRNCGIGITVLDPVDPQAPNGVFPNNWFSTNPDGTVTIYPMCTPSRRKEKDLNIRTALEREGYRLQQVIDLSHWEDRGLFLEGTGSMVLDHVHRLAYAALSPRTHEMALNAWCEMFGYSPMAFMATMDGTLTGQAVYHTNVVLSIGEGFAVVCPEAIPYPAERREVEEELHKAGKEVIAISLEQMHRYVGNLLQLRSQAPNPVLGSAHSGPFIFLSSTAFEALRPEQRMALQRHGQLVPVPVSTIERVGGGSVRCMLAENFLG